jgi:O-antigen/teichoic acid export membrane protein
VSLDGEAEVRSPLRALFSQQLVRAGLASYAFTFAILVSNLLGGIIAARALAPDGRGASVAIVMVMQLGGVVASVGAVTTLAYHAAREPHNAGRLHGTWLVILVPLSIAGIVLAELLLPVLFGAQSAHTIYLARIFLLSIVLVLWGQVNNGLLLGLHEFTLYNLLRFLQTALSTLAFAVLWQLDALTVESSLVVWSATQLVLDLVGATRLLGTAGIGRPSRELARRTLHYGVRAHGDAVAGTLNTRLDLVILPAYVAATGVGLYSVAANVSLIVNMLATSLAALVMPSAARDQERGPRTIVLSLQATLALAGVSALVLFVGAEIALSTIYGDAFRSATDTLRLLLPGTVMYAGATVLAAGLHSAGRPFRATTGQLGGAAVTLVGLVVFLPSGGITAAAVVSTIAYSAVFLANLFAYRRTVGLEWRDFAEPPRALRRRAAGGA